MSQTDVQQPTFDDLEILAEVSQLLTLLDIDRVLQQVIILVAKAVGAEKVSLFLHDDSEIDWQHIFVTRDLTPDESFQVVRSVYDKGLAGWVVREKQATIVRDTEEDERWYVFSDDTYAARSALCVPLLFRDQVLAVITLVHSAPYHFNDYHLRLMTIIANQATVAVHNAQLFSHLQAQQRQLETVLQAIPDVLLVLDHNGNTILVNDAALQFLDAPSIDAVIGKPLSAFLDHTASLKDVLAVVEESARERKPKSIEVHSDRTKQDFQVKISVWHDNLYDLHGYVVAMHDVTTLRDLHRFKDEMLKIASHDLRSPLALIAGYADLVGMDTPANSPMQDYINVIRRSTERMNGLLDDLLRVEQVKKSPLELHERVDLNELVNNIMGSTAPLATRKTQELTYEPPTQNLPMIMGDPALIRRAMENLVTNAIKYTQEYGKIHIRAYADDSRFHFMVEDNGIGISQEHIQRIFESFYRVKDARAGNVTGFGLGLSLVKTIVERHGGDVWVDSQVGGGSRFGFWVPL